MKNIYVDRIDGHEDHMHCLFKLPATMTIASALQHFKGESSRWMNLENLIPENFRWCRGYYARSVSRADIDEVREYIDNHSRLNYSPELKKFLKSMTYKGSDDEKYG